MPRKRLVRTNVFPYHITARVNNREDFPVEIGFAWKALTSELYLQFILHGAKTHAFVLMPNHLHLLLSASAVDRTMQEVLSSSTRIINTKARRTGHLFGERYFWSVISDPLYYAHALKYIYRNPVKAELCESVECYPFSTLSGLWGRVPLPIGIHTPPNNLDRLVPKSFDSLEKWLNQAHRAEEAAAIQKALRKKEFKLPVERNKRKLVALSAIDAPPSPKGSDTKWWWLSN